MPRTRKNIEKLAIDRNLPPPETRARSTYGLTAESMEPGDSVILEDEYKRQRMVDALRYRGMTYATRKCKDGGGWRIWRLS